MRTTTTLLEGDRAQLDVEVPADRVAHDVEHTLEHLARNVRVPGFRQGKVPPRVVLQRLGWEEVLGETLNEHLMGWYVSAVEAAALRPVGRPEVAWDALPAEGEPFRFRATVRLRPKGRLPESLRLQAPREPVEVPADEVQRELEAVIETGLPLRPVEDRPAAEGDFVELDFSATAGGRPLEGTSARGYHAQLGSGRLLPPVEQGVAGMRPGETKQIEVSFPSDYPDRRLAGRNAVFEVHLHSLAVREQRPLDDELARAVSEFDSVDELRADIERVLRERVEARVDASYRRAVLEALGRAVEVDLDDEVVAEQTEELLFALARRFERLGLPFEAYLQRSGQTVDQVRAELRPEAIQTLRQEIALGALAEREGITVEDDRLAAMLGEDADSDDPEEVERDVQEVLRSPAKESVRQDYLLRAALDRAVELATPISPAQAAARDALWTPEKGETEKPKPELWTPGQPR